MNNKALRFASTLVVLALAVSISLGGGYQINEQGARATGMGGAFVARALDGSAIFYNAAGLGFQKGIHVMAGTTLIFPSTDFTPTTGSAVSMVSQVFYPSNLYISYSYKENWVFGLGVYNAYGLGTEWPNDWIGRQLTVKTDLQTFYINPTVAYKVNDKLSFGAGVSFVLASAKIKYRVATYSSLTPPTPAAVNGTAALDGTGNGVSFNVGAIYKPMDKLSVGVSYRSLVKIELSGTAAFTDMLALQSFFPGGTGTVTLPMPSNLMVGVAYQVTPKLTVEGDFQFVGWSSYDKLVISIPNGPASPLGVLQKSPAPAVKNWDDGMLFRIGGEYQLNDKLALRAGFILDYTPQPDSKVEPMLPDANKTDISIGGGYQISENLHVDASFLYVMFSDRTTLPSNDLRGTYKSSASLVSLNFGYLF